MLLWKFKFYIFGCEFQLANLIWEKELALNNERDKLKDIMCTSLCFYLSTT